MQYNYTCRLNGDLYKWPSDMPIPQIGSLLKISGEWWKVTDIIYEPETHEIFIIPIYINTQKNWLQKLFS